MSACWFFSFPLHFEYTVAHIFLDWNQKGDRWKWVIGDSSPHGSAAVELILMGHCQSQRYTELRKTYWKNDLKASPLTQGIPVPHISWKLGKFFREVLGWACPGGAAAGACGRRRTELHHPLLGICSVSAHRGALGFAPRIRSSLCLPVLSQPLDHCSCITFWQPD